MLEAESTVLFLLEDFAKVHSSFVNDITKYIKNSIGAPNMVFGPFMLAFLLTMSCCVPYEVIVSNLSIVKIKPNNLVCCIKVNYICHFQFVLYSKTSL